MDWEAAVTAVALLVGVCGLLGVGYRYVLLPNLLAELVVPVAETHRQLTGDSDTTAEPPLRDLVHRTADDVTALRRELGVMGRAFDGHLDWSQDEVDALWRELKALRDAEDRHNR